MTFEDYLFTKTFFRERTESDEGRCKKERSQEQEERNEIILPYMGRKKGKSSGRGEVSKKINICVEVP